MDFESLEDNPFYGMTASSKEADTTSASLQNIADAIRLLGEIEICVGFVIPEELIDIIKQADWYKEYAESYICNSLEQRFGHDVSLYGKRSGKNQNECADYLFDKSAHSGRKYVRLIIMQGEKLYLIRRYDDEKLIHGRFKL